MTERKLPLLIPYFDDAITAGLPAGYVNPMRIVVAQPSHIPGVWILLCDWAGHRNNLTPVYIRESDWMNMLEQ